MTESSEQKPARLTPRQQAELTIAEAAEKRPDRKFVIVGNAAKRQHANEPRS